MKSSRVDKRKLMDVFQTVVTAYLTENYFFYKAKITNSLKFIFPY